MTQEQAKPIEIKITSHMGNLVKYEIDNEGLRDKLDVPYRPKFKHGKFRLPSGKAKYERFGENATDEEILQFISKKYSNFKFRLSSHTSHQVK